MEKKEKKQGKPKRTPLEKIQTLQTMKVAKLFFNTYLTPSIVTKIMHKEAYEKIKEKNKQGFVMPYIRECLKEWKDAGFIEKSPVKLPFLVEKRTGNYWLKNYGYRLNLNPLYFYCKDKHNIEFTKEERAIIAKRIGLECMRKQIFLQYPNDDIINAMIKFYLKQYGILPIEILDKKERELLETLENFVEKDQKEIKKGMEKIKVKQPKEIKKEKKIPFILFERELFNVGMKTICEGLIDKKTGKLKIPLNNLKEYARKSKILLYITSYNKNPKLISSINKKFKIALGIV